MRLLWELAHPLGMPVRGVTMRRALLIGGPALALSLCVLLVMADRPALGAAAATQPANAHGLVLRVTRFEPAVSHPPPFAETITDAAAIQRLYQAALTLPVAPYIRMRCLQMSVTYHLVFLQDGRIIHIIDAEPNGCSLVVVYPAYTREITPAYRQLLAQTLGVTSLVPASP